jgi:hypothetical protein
MKILDPIQTIGILPDIHTRLDKLKAFINRYDDEVDHWVQLGDWFDAFKPKADAREVAEFLKEKLHDPKWTILWGNHDVHYFDGPKCSGYQQTTQYLVDEVMGPEDWDKFHVAARIGNEVLCTHAGVTPESMNAEADYELWRFDMDFTGLEAYIMRGDFGDPLLQAGRMRGGQAKVGGIYWLDWSEMRPFNSFTQVVGHTFYQGSKPLVKMNYNLRPRAYCIDNGLRQIMIWKEGKLQHHTLLELDGEQ